MGEIQSTAETDDLPDDSQAVKPEKTDVDFNHVRGLMYALVTICVFCASILLGPDAQILPADGELKLPILDLTIKQGSFLYFGPIIIICVSMYTYLFLLKILPGVNQRHEYSDKFIFTMKNPAAQIATYCIFFWLPTLILFAFALKALPRPESENLLGVALIFLIFTVSIQLLLRRFPFHFMNIVTVSIFCAVLVLYGLVGDSGWLGKARLELHEWRPMALDGADLKKRDLQGVEIRHVKAESIMLKDADLRDALIKDAYLPYAILENADLRDATVDCTSLKFANLQKADLRNSTIRVTNFKNAKFRLAKLRYASFYALEDEVTCSRKRLAQTALHDATLEEADLSHANLSKVSLLRTTFNGANLEDAKIIGAEITESNFSERTFLKTGLTKLTRLSRADLRCSSLEDATMKRAVMIEAELGGTNLTRANLANADLSGANFDSLNCSKSCIDGYINNEQCSGSNIRAGEEGCDCDQGDKENIATTLLAFTKLPFANLRGASLKKVNLTGADLRGANLQDTDFDGADLTGANLLLAKFSNTDNLDCPELEKAKYWKAAIREKKLECGYPYLDFEGLTGGSKKILKQRLEDLHRTLEAFAQWSRKEPRDPIERKAQRETYVKMANAEMSGIHLMKLNLEGLYLNGVKLGKAWLSGTNLKDAKLKNADLQGAVLVGTDLRGADLTGSMMAGAVLNEADLDKTTLHGVTGLRCKHLTVAKNWRNSYRDDELICGASLPPDSSNNSNIFQ